MSAASISFFASALIALLAGLFAVLARRAERALAGFAIAFAALLVPLIQLGATTVAAVMLLARGVVVVLLGALVQLRGDQAGRAAKKPIAYWVPAGLGLLGFVWVVLATGSRQVVELGATLKPGARFGDGGALLIELGNNFVVPAVLVALLALCAVIAAVLGLAGVREAS
jgi:hypothetical protein